MTQQQTWQESLNSRLAQRLIRPLIQPGVINSQMAKGIIERSHYFTNRLPLLANLRLASVSLQSAQTPIVYAQEQPPVIRTDSGQESPSSPSLEADNLPVVQAKLVSNAQSGGVRHQPANNSPTVPSSYPIASLLPLSENKTDPQPLVQRQRSPKLPTPDNQANASQSVAPSPSTSVVVAHPQQPKQPLSENKTDPQPLVQRQPSPKLTPDNQANASQSVAPSPSTPVVVAHPQQPKQPLSENKTDSQPLVQRQPSPKLTPDNQANASQSVAPSPSTPVVVAHPQQPKQPLSENKTHSQPLVQPQLDSDRARIFQGFTRRSDASRAGDAVNLVDSQQLPNVQNTVKAEPHLDELPIVQPVATALYQRDMGNSVVGNLPLPIVQSQDVKTNRRAQVVVVPERRIEAPAPPTSLVFSKMTTEVRPEANSTNHAAADFNNTRQRMPSAGGQAGFNTEGLQTQNYPEAARHSPRDRPVPAAQVDVDEIANKVERKLMRRLVIESERRGKMRWP